MNIKTKLTLLSGGALLALGIVTATAFTGMSRLSAATESITGNRVPSIVASAAARTLLVVVTRTSLDPSLEENNFGEESRKRLVAALADKRRVWGLAKVQLDAYAKLPMDGEEAATWKEFGPKLERWQQSDAKLVAVLEKIIAADNKQDYAALWPVYFDIYRSQRDLSMAARSDLEKIVNLNTKFAGEDASSAQALAASVRNIMGIIAGLAFAALIAAAFFIGRAIGVPVNRLRDTMGEISTSLNFTRKVELKGRDELGEVASAFNGLIGKVRQSIFSVQDLSTRMKASTEEVSTAAQQVEASSQHQSQSTTSMAAAVEEMTVSISQVSDAAGEAMNLSRDSEEMSKEGARIISGTMTDMNEIATAIEGAAQVIGNLGRQSESIISIVGTIREIAGQTNLLALNAAIEAARAGDEGRGFAVVADEVRKLAEQSADSSSRISTTINEIVEQTRQAVTQMQDVVSRAHAGREGANRASEFMAKIEKSSAHVSSVVNNISDALKEQTAASEEIAKHVESIAQMTEESHAASKSTADNARNLLDAVQGVDTTLKVFSVTA